ncbi:hypothetical protein E2C01_060106 [Portunus trituberculatus]|uniref:Uncharacterized protein n=1 Tax=Portunus trituberculatus TaxID=210409 RepID=A0A5B7H8E1_PORTR|nr:hypothetical protein [Portunus trituberculatus]
MISTLSIAKTLLRINFIISVALENRGHITYIFKRLLFQSHGFLKVV